jgi:hypothetical protein
MNLEVSIIVHSFRRSWPAMANVPRRAGADRCLPKHPRNIVAESDVVNQATAILYQQAASHLARREHTAGNPRNAALHGNQQSKIKTCDEPFDLIF